MKMSNSTSNSVELKKLLRDNSNCVIALESGCDYLQLNDENGKVKYLDPCELKIKVCVIK